MTATLRETSGFHDAVGASQVRQIGWHEVAQNTYTFENFFHPFVSELIGQLNQKSVAGLLDLTFLQSLTTPVFEKYYTPLPSETVNPKYFDKTIDVTPGGPYANYNWELLYHIPIAVAVHLSKTQHFAEGRSGFTSFSIRPPQILPISRTIQPTVTGGFWDFGKVRLCRASTCY